MASPLNPLWLRPFISIVVGFSMLAVVASMATAQSAYEVLHGFTGGAAGGFPLANLVQADDGDFYGMTSSGGTAVGDAVVSGTVFKITADGDLATLHSFDCATDGCLEAGYIVQDGLIQARDGDFYGTTPSYGPQTDGSSLPGFGGTIFRITRAGGLKVLHAFECAKESCIPSGGLIQARDGHFYGTTGGGYGGSTDVGSVFKITSERDFTTLHSFDCATDGCVPFAGLIEARDGNLYGTTSGFVGPDAGTVFKITLTPTGATFTVLHAFSYNDDDNGTNPIGDLIQGGDGDFYGTTMGGGEGGGCGTIFKITATGTFTRLYSLTSNGLDVGCTPIAGLVQASDGNLYGTTVGFEGSQTTIYRITTTGFLTTVHTFDCSRDGCEPHGSLIQASDKRLYGTALQGGPGGEGVVFRFALPPPPSNDDVDRATAISALPFNDSIDMSTATVATDDPIPSCARPPVGNVPRTTWYSFTPVQDALIAYDAFGSSYEPDIAVYTGDRGALTEVQCSGGYAAPVLHARANVTYLFLIQNLNGSLVLNVREPLRELGPARVWIGLRNSDNVGLRLDLLGEVFLDDAKIGEGQLDNVRTGTSGFNNAVLHAIPLRLTGGPVNVPAGSTLKLTVSARRTCFGGGHASGTARLWYNGQPIDSGATRDAGSRFETTVGSTPVSHFLRAGVGPLDLDTVPGTSRRSIDVGVNATGRCPERTFKAFGTWSGGP